MPDPVKPDYLNFPPVPDEAPWKKWLRDKGWGDLYVGPPPAAGAGGEKSAATEDPMAGTAYEGDSEFLQALVDAIKSGDLSKFLQSYSLSRSEYAAITKFIDSMSQPGLYTSDEEHVSTTDSEKLKQQLAVAALPSAGLWTAQKEYRSQRDAYNDLVRQLKEANDGVLPEGFPAFEAWAALQGGLKSGVIARGTQFVISPTEQYVAHTGETWRSIADERGINIAELMKANGATNPDEDVTGAMVSLPPASALGATNGRGEQTMPTDTADPNANPTDPGDTSTPNDVGGYNGENNTDPLQRALRGGGMGQFIYETLRGKDWSPDAIGMIGGFAPQLQEIARLTDMADPNFGQLGREGEYQGIANDVLNNFMSAGRINFDSIDQLLRTVASGEHDSTMGLDPTQVMDILGNLMYGRYSDMGWRSLFGDAAKKEMAYKYNQQYNQNPNQSVLEFILSQMGGY